MLPKIIKQVSELEFNTGLSHAGVMLFQPHCTAHQEEFVVGDKVKEWKEEKGKESTNEGGAVRKVRSKERERMVFEYLGFLQEFHDLKFEMYTKSLWIPCENQDICRAFFPSVPRANASRNLAGT